MGTSLVDDIYRPLHPWHQEFVDVICGAQKALLASKIFGDKTVLKRARDGFDNPYGSLVVQLKQLVQTVAHYLWVLQKIGEPLFQASELAVDQMNAASTAGDRQMLIALDLLGQA